MIVTTKAIVFSAIKYSEADLIVSCFTESSGLKSYLLRSILKSKKGKLKPSYFQVLSQLEIVAEHKNKGTLERIQEAKVLQHYKSLHTDVIKSGMMMFLSELLKNSIQEEEINLALFQFIENSLCWLDEHDDIANFHIFFLLKLSAFLGFYPDTSHMDKPYFNLSEGNFQDSIVGAHNESGDIVEVLKQFFGIEIDALSEVKLTKSTRLAVLNLLLVYYQLHLQGFKNPKSLLVLNQLFY
jgi:DNA repair protein RecO (recombination protein O)